VDNQVSRAQEGLAASLKSTSVGLHTFMMALVVISKVPFQSKLLVASFNSAPAKQ